MKRIITDVKLWDDNRITFFTNWTKQNNKICFTLDLEEVLTYIGKAVKEKQKAVEE